MIVKDETDTLRKCLESVRPHVDEIVIAWNGSSPDTRAILDEFQCKIVPYEWRDDFAHARNFSFEQASHDVILWLDADDVLEGGEYLREVSTAFTNPRVGAVWLAYNYDQDETGNCVMLLWRERLTRKGMLEWRGVIHETQQPKREHIMLKEDRIVVRHQVRKERVVSSAERNLRISENEYKRQKEQGDVDPRIIYDYARSLHALGRLEDCIPVFKEFLTVSENSDDLYTTYHLLADIYRKARWYESAINASLEAVKVDHKRPEAYFDLALTYFCKDEWEKVVWYTKQGYQCPDVEGVAPRDPIAIKGKPLRPLAIALFHLGRFQDALVTIEKALQFFPNNDFLSGLRDQYAKAVYQDKIERALLDVKYYLATEEPDKLEPLSKALPSIVKDHPVFVRLANQYRAAESWRNRLVIYCGSSYEFWDPRSVKSGIGGSEEAVINIAPLLAKLGWQVEVYNNCLEEMNVDGVVWKPFWTYDRTQKCAVFLVWRDNRNVLQAPEGSKVCIWLHDRQKTERWSDELVKRIDKFFFLSEYHRTDLPEVPKEKVFITSNGINPAHFAVKEPRDPLRCVYASSPDRGLDVMLQLWPQIRKEVPDAQLHVYYGFTPTYTELHAKHPGMLKFRDDILRDLKQPGVVYHGRVGHQELATDMLRSALWLYPTYFTEISCITAMKAQAAGMIPVTTSLAALQETVQHGYKIGFTIHDARTQMSFVQLTVDLLKNPEKQEKMRAKMQPWAKEHFAWEGVAKQWHELFHSLCVQSVSSS